MTFASPVSATSSMQSSSAGSSSDGTEANSNTNTSVAAVTKTCSDLASLTDEVLLEILYCVSPLEILRHVCRVSKRLAGITTTRDTDLRYWRYHPNLPRSLKERIQAEDGGNKKRKAGKTGSSANHDRQGGNDKSGAPSLKLERRQLQMLVCLCTTSAAADNSGALPRLLRQVDLLPSQETARSTSVEVFGGLMLRRRACLASSEDHEHEDITRVLRQAARIKNHDDEVIRRLHGHHGGRQEEDSDENGGGGGGDTTDDADEDNMEQIRHGQAIPPAAGFREASPSYDIMWEYIRRQEEDRGPPNMNGHIDLGFFMRVMRQENTYWSSKASESCDTNEDLLFATQGCYHSLITDVAIKPFRELRLDEGHVAYTWPKIVLSVYSLPDVEDDDDYYEEDEDCGDDENRETSVWSSGNVTEPPSNAMERQRRQDPQVIIGEQSVGDSSDSSSSSPIPGILAGHTPVYTSSPRECDATNTGWQHFQLPSGIVGNVVVFSLQGKNHRQFPESGYYVCCERVECRGVPLWTGP